MRSFLRNVERLSFAGENFKGFEIASIPSNLPSKHRSKPSLHLKLSKQFQLHSNFCHFLVYLICSSRFSSMLVAAFDEMLRRAISRMFVVVKWIKLPFCAFNFLSSEICFCFSFIADCPKGSTALHSNVELRRGERVGGFIAQDLREQQAPTWHVSSVCVHQRRVDMVSFLHKFAPVNLKFTEIFFQLQRDGSVCARLQGRWRHTTRSRSRHAIRSSSRSPATSHAYHQQHERDAEVLWQQHGQQRRNDADAAVATKAKRSRDATRTDPPETP